MQLTPFQVSLRDRVLDLLGRAGVTVAVREKRARGEEDAPPELSVLVTFEIERVEYEVWLYAAAAGVLEGGDDWWPFDAEDFDGEDALAAEVLAHLSDVLEEHGL